MLGLGLGLLGAGLAGSIGEGVMGGKAAREKAAAGRDYSRAMKGISGDYERYRESLPEAKMQAMGQELTAWDPALASMKRMYGAESVPDWSQLMKSPITPNMMNAEHKNYQDPRKDPMAALAGPNAVGDAGSNAGELAVLVQIASDPNSSPAVKAEAQRRLQASGGGQGGAQKPGPRQRGNPAAWSNPAPMPTGAGSGRRGGY